MATKRKRSLRGLGGSPEHHREAAKAAHSSAVSSFKKALDAMQGRPACHTALDHYSIALEDFGGYASDYVEGRMGQSADGANQFNALDKMSRSVRREFAAKCLTMPSMSGLGRRPSRRRK